METYRFREVNYSEIKHRALELLQAGAIDGRTFDEIRDSESCVKSWCIRTALDIACCEIERQLPPPRDRRKAILRKPEFTKAEKEIWRHLRTKTRR